MSAIVLVEDDANTAVITRKILTRLGRHTVTVTVDLDEAAGMARRGQVDLFIVDVSLSNATLGGLAFDGVDFSKILKGHDATRSIPILLSTAHAMRGDREHLLGHSRANGYITKPFTPEELLRAVNTLVGDRDPT